MATADDYANWIVKNEARKGTPEFNTVVQAYQEAKAEEAKGQVRPWKEVGLEAASNVPKDIWQTGKEMVGGIGQAIAHPIDTVTGLAKGYREFYDKAMPKGLFAQGKDLYEAYKSGQFEREMPQAEAALQRQVAERPVQTISTATLPVALAGGLAARAPGMVGRVGRVVETAAQTVDPISLATKAVAAPIKGALETNINVPTREELRTSARKAYDESRAAGVVVKADSFDNFVNSLRNNLVDDEGKKVLLNEKLHPKAAAALDALESFKGKPKTFEELDQMRQIIKDAGASPDAADRRVAAIMRDRLDSYVDKLGMPDIISGAPRAANDAIVRARDYWSRFRKSDVVDDLLHDAELSATNYSQSGMENALRIEFRKLAKNDQKMRMFSPEERKAIEDVVKGGPAVNTLRFLGKLSPSGVVSGGIGTSLGYAVGGPAGAIALPALGYAAKQSASALTSRAATRAGELMRAGKAGPTTVGGKLADMLSQYGDQLVATYPSMAMAVDRAKRTIAAGKQLDPYYARQLAEQLGRMQAQEQEQ